MWITHILNHILKMKDLEEKNTVARKEMEENNDMESDTLKKIKVTVLLSNLTKGFHQSKSVSRSSLQRRCILRHQSHKKTFHWKGLQGKIKQSRQIH